MITQTAALNSIGSLLVSMAALAQKYPIVIELIEGIVQSALKAKSQKDAWRRVIREVLAKGGPEVAKAIADEVLKSTTAVRGKVSKAQAQRR